MRRFLCALAGWFTCVAVVRGFAGDPGPAVAFAIIAAVCWAARVNFDYPDGAA